MIENFNIYQKEALKTAINISLQNGVMGLCGEAGECIEVVKKHLFQNKDLDINKIVEEVGDCLWYIAIIAESIGVSMEEIATKNIKKLQKRYNKDDVDSITVSDILYY